MADPASERGGVPQWLARAKAAPARIDRLHAVHEDLARALAEVAEGIGRLDAELSTIREWVADADVKQGWTAGELALLRQLVGERVDDLDGVVTAHAAVLQRAVDGPRRDAALQSLLAGLDPPAAPRPGLSIFTISWNHGGFLADAVRSGLAVLDALPGGVGGEVLVLDNASVDETPAVVEQLRAEDDRVRSFRADHNLGLARSRGALLQATSTSHAFMLDADNTAVAAGVAELYEVAQHWDAALVYGNVLKVDADDVPVGLISNEPLSPAFFASNYIDNMATIDVARVRALGGWSTDPVLEHVDDWALTHHVLRHGGLVGFVPTVVGRYRVLAGASNRSVPDPRIGDERVVRTFNADSRLNAEQAAAFVAHPRTGPLWATPRACRLQPSLAPPPAARQAGEAEGRLLVVAPGGVGNAGDDAITLAVVQRLRANGPSTRVDVLTDGDAPVGLGLLARWRGTLTEAVADGGSALLASERYAGAYFAGGGSLTSRWREGLLAPRTALAGALAEAGVPFALSGQGIGPLDDEDLPLLGSLLAGATAVSVRDHESAEAGVAAGADPSLITVTGDDALTLAPADPAAVTAARASAGLAVDEPYLALTARTAPYVGADPARLEAWATAVDALAAERDWTVVGLALNDRPPEPEAAVLARLAHGGAMRRARWRLLEVGRNPPLLAGLCAGARAAVAHSYHAALFTLAGGRPAVLAAQSEYYRRKALGLARLAGLPEAFAVDDPAGPDALAERLDVVASTLGAGASLDPATRAVEAWWAARRQALTGSSGAGSAGRR